MVKLWFSSLIICLSVLACVGKPNDKYYNQSEATLNSNRSESSANNEITKNSKKSGNSNENQNQHENGDDRNNVEGSLLNKLQQIRSRRNFGNKRNWNNNKFNGGNQFRGNQRNRNNNQFNGANQFRGNQPNRNKNRFNGPNQFQGNQPNRNKNRFNGPNQFQGNQPNRNKNRFNGPNQFQGNQQRTKVVMFTGPSNQYRGPGRPCHGKKYGFCHVETTYTYDQFGKQIRWKNIWQWNTKPPIIKNKNQIDVQDVMANQGKGGPQAGFRPIGQPPPGFLDKVFDSDSDLNQNEMYDERGHKWDDSEADEHANDMKDTVNIIDQMHEAGDDSVYDKDSGIGFQATEDDSGVVGSELKRIDQMVDGIEVDGAGLIEHEYNGELIWLVDKYTGKKTRQIRRPKTKKRVGTVMTRSRARSKTFNKADYDPSEAMRKFKELKGGELITDEVEEVIISNDYGHTAEVVYRVSFLKMGKDPSVPMAIYNSTTNELIEEWNNMEGVALAVGVGPGGNDNGRWEYGKDNVSKLIINDMGNGVCSYSTPNVTVIDLKHSYMMDDNDTFTYSCYNQESDEINGGYSALNDALYHAQLVYDMFKAWYNIPVWKNGTVIKVHYGDNVANAKFYPRKEGRYIYIGDGNKFTFPLTTLQIVAHEMAHGLTYETSQLEMSNDQSAALNEAFSDATVMAIERYVYGSNKEVEWKIGFNLFKNSTRHVLRCMDEPECLGDNTMGVESPSGIDNVKDLKEYGQTVYHIGGIWRKIFYELSQKYDVWDVYDIFFITNTKFWQQKTKFKQAAELMLRAVSEMKEGLHNIWDYHYLKIDEVIEVFKQVGINCVEENKSYTCEGENLK